MAYQWISIQEAADLANVAPRMADKRLCESGLEPKAGATRNRKL